MLPEWTSQQRAALQVMGIPVWERKAETPTVFYYRLGPLYLCGPKELPVPVPNWLNDLCLYFEQRPVAVKAPAQTPDFCFNYADWLESPITAQMKQTFWQTLVNAER
ncbi:hypothetical protein [Idiomarina sp. HP20-50]|uniref:hypothetical protein n=1 Tax=Idiomarina sp. HP20-50 TaxID=3070813 RepID=UPI00294B0CEA|nr:hypothetical protein [Idiomarina sp. HP20-50]MDV6317125.1 hypothetical protein [Idiomarina sp. HP20-50]